MTASMVVRCLKALLIYFGRLHCRGRKILSRKADLPEGHTILVTALDRNAAAFSGHKLSVSSPGKFSEGASLLDSQF